MTDGITEIAKLIHAGTIETGNKYGNMNNYERDNHVYTQEEINSNFLMKRIALGKELGFDGRFMFKSEQATENGSYKVIDKDLIDSMIAHREFIINEDIFLKDINKDFLEDYMVCDGWQESIGEDILMITTDTPGVVIGHNVADYPVVIMRDLKKGVTAIGHCSAEMIDIKLPMMIADAMNKAYGCREENILATVSACAGEKSYIYDKYPEWAKDENVWKNSIVEKKHQFYINLRRAITEQFAERKITRYYTSDIDTITNPNFYSKYAAYNGHPEKYGDNFAGAYYKKLGR